MMMMILFLYSATSNYMLLISALELLKNERIYRLFFTHTNIHKAAIVGASTISFTPNCHTQWGGRDIYFKSLERPGWDSNSCFQSLVISALDHYATMPPMTMCQLLRILHRQRICYCTNNQITLLIVQSLFNSCLLFTTRLPRWR